MARLRKGENAQGWHSPGPLAKSPEVIDRALIIVCAVVWLLALGFGVAAGAALVDLGRGRAPGDGDDGTTPWLLYVVIGVSALVIVLAIPLLLRARRDALAEPVKQSPRVPARSAVDRDPPGYPGPTPARYSASVISAEELDRMWLRCGVGVLAATGVAMAAVAIATHLMALDMSGVAWGVYAVAGVVTVVMAAIPVFFLRQLRAALAQNEA
jgi:Protein of unknown function (DUF2561)